MHLAPVLLVAALPSACGENGIDAERGRAAVWRVDPADGNVEVFASGLRNPVGYRLRAANRRALGRRQRARRARRRPRPRLSDRVHAGGFYGWPYSYFGDHLDPRVAPQRPDLVARALVPDYALGAHVAPLGLTFADGAELGPGFADGAFIGEHGSWNRRPRSGYAWCSSRSATAARPASRSTS